MRRGRLPSEKRKHREQSREYREHKIAVGCVPSGALVCYGKIAKYIACKHRKKCRHKPKTYQCKQKEQGVVTPIASPSSNPITQSLERIVSR